MKITIAVLRTCGVAFEGADVPDGRAGLTGLDRLS